MNEAYKVRIIEIKEFEKKKKKSNKFLKQILFYLKVDHYIFSFDGLDDIQVCLGYYR